MSQTRATRAKGGRRRIEEILGQLPPRRAAPYMELAALKVLPSHAADGVDEVMLQTLRSLRTIADPSARARVASKP